jgi:hypothetical protein
VRTASPSQRLLELRKRSVFQSFLAFVPSLS